MGGDGRAHLLNNRSDASLAGGGLQLCEVSYVTSISRYCRRCAECQTSPHRRTPLYTATSMGAILCNHFRAAYRFLQGSSMDQRTTWQESFTSTSMFVHDFPAKIQANFNSVTFTVIAHKRAWHVGSKKLPLKLSPGIFEEDIAWNLAWDLGLGSFCLGALAGDLSIGNLPGNF